MLELRGKVAECYVECFCRMFYVVFKDTTSGDIDNIENIMKDSYDEWASGDNEEIIDICCEEYILSTLNAYKDKIVAVIYEDDKSDEDVIMIDYDRPMGFSLYVFNKDDLMEV